MAVMTATPIHMAMTKHAAVFREPLRLRNYSGITDT
jgi:hypothetical protein